jgi:inorganic triphosphatase YgiF
MPTEVEARFRAEGPGPLDALSTDPGLGPATLGTARTIDETDAYLDTVDGRLTAALWACRLRKRAGAYRISLKGPPEPSAEAWLHRRPEVEGDATSSLRPQDWPASAARSHLERLTGGGALVEHLRLRQRRTERSVHVDGRLLGMLSLDVVAISDARRGAGDLFVVELELAADEPGATALLVRLATVLAARPGLAPDPRTKLEHALLRLAAP